MSAIMNEIRRILNDDLQEKGVRILDYLVRVKRETAFKRINDDDAWRERLFEVKEYKLIANVVIETKPEHLDKIAKELTLACVEIVEKYDSYMGGGFQLEEYVDENK